MDLNPPPWRGQAGSTFQAWEFRVKPPHWPRLRHLPSFGSFPMPPTRRRNTYHAFPDDLQMYADDVVRPFSDWYPIYAGMQGVWRLERPAWNVNAPSLSVIVPNCGDLKKSKEAWLQVTYKNLAGHPRAEVIPAPRGWGFSGAATPYEVKTRPAGKGWTHRTWKFRFDYCPRDEIIKVFPPAKGPIYIDQIVFDTLCSGAGVMKKKRRRGKR
jgi:hypothetical protein